MGDEWKQPMWLLQQIVGYFNNVMTKLDAIQNMFGTSGDADVSPADIRLGKKAYNGTTLVTGTMPENVAVAKTLNAGEAYVIPQGYHDGTGQVTANSLESQTDGTATAAQILSGKTAYVDGVKVTGSMTNNGSKSAALNAGGSFTIPQGYHDGTGKVTANSLASQTAGTAVAGNILNGKTAWVGGNKVTGSMGNKAGTTVEASAVTQDDTNTYFNVPAAGYYDTNSKVYTPNSNLGVKAEYIYTMTTGGVWLNTGAKWSDYELFIIIDEDSKQYFASSNVKPSSGNFITLSSNVNVGNAVGSVPSDYFAISSPTTGTKNVKAYGVKKINIVFN